MSRNEEKKIEVGKRYKITLEDCCIEGEIDAGAYLSYDAENDKAIFENCKIGPDWGAWSVEIQDED